jgi:hypothetical protein
MGKSAELIPMERIQGLIFLVRGEKVMLDSDLAALYGVTTGNLNKAVKRNQDRFPSDFMFQLNSEEENLIFQIGISRWINRPKCPVDFVRKFDTFSAPLLRF